MDAADRNEQERAIAVLWALDAIRQLVEELRQMAADAPNPRRAYVTLAWARAKDELIHEQPRAFVGKVPGRTHIMARSRD